MNKEDLKKTAIETANDTLNNKIEYIVGCRKICELLNNIYENPHDKGFDIFYIIETQTDHLPAGNLREQWNQDSLKIKNKEIKEKSDFYKNDLIKGCKKLISQFS